MSIASDALEQDIVLSVRKHIGERLPKVIPKWMRDEGIVPGAEICSVDGIGSKDKKNKTDVIIYLSDSEPIKISAKLNNADHFGNWYGHKRFIEEFGEAAFRRMTKASTDFANRWAKTATAPFVGVSICFGRRSGGTAQPFTEIFTPGDIIKVARGVGTGISSANCMYIGDRSITSIEELINVLKPITEETVVEVTGGFMVAHRPINPMTEYSNRGKNVYTRFMPYKPLSEKRIIETPKELFSLGTFVEVKADALNHNHILDDLKNRYNIVIPRKMGSIPNSV